MRKEAAAGPLHNSVFRSLWLATIVSNIGTWMQDVGSSWLMTSLSPAPIMVALVQAATTLPMFLLAIPAGALADVFDRRKILLVSQVWMFFSALLLAFLAWQGWVTPWILLAFTFALSIGSAINSPAWQAITPELVSKEQLPNAISLQSSAINIARSIGPALGGLVVAAQGPHAAFLLNAMTFLGVVYVLFRWRREAEKSVLPTERFFSAMKVGLRYVRHTAALQAVVIRTGAFMFFGSAIWGLLPLVVKQELNQGPLSLGILLGFLGVGAITSAILTPKLRKKMASDIIVLLATTVFACVFLGFAYLKNFPLLCVLMFFAGIAWLANLSSFNIAAQSSSPSWVKARALSIYLVVFFGSMSLGSIVWGALATQFSISISLTMAAMGCLVSLITIIPYKLASSEGLELTPSHHWYPPFTQAEVTHDQGPVLVTIEYSVNPEQLDSFLKALYALRPSRLRSGAIRWEVYTDIAEPSVVVEQFVVESWLEHLRQHERVTLEDKAAQDSVNQFHTKPSPPVVKHMIYCDRKK